MTVVKGPPSETTQADAIARASIRGVMLRLLLANVAGMLTVAGILIVWFPLTDAGQPRDNELNLVVFGAYTAGTLILGLPLNWLLLRALVAWIRGRRPGRFLGPLVLRIPPIEAVFTLLGWLVAAVLFSAINSSPRIGLGIAVAGLMTSLIAFLAIEQHFRPIFAMALDGQVRGRRSNDLLPRLMLFWIAGSGIPLLIMGLGTSASGTGLHWSPRAVLVLVVTVVVGGAIMRAAAKSITRPVERVRGAMAAVAGGDLEAHVPVDDAGEIGRLSEGFNHMVDSLREQQRVREQFSRQVGDDAAEWALQATGPDAPEGLRGEILDVSVIFVDLDGCTAYSEKHSPHDIVSMLNRFFEAVDAAVRPNGGWINKFEGDAAMCIFGAPRSSADHAKNALDAALAIRRATTATDAAPKAGIGVATGSALAGMVGSQERYEYTVIGDVVNVASRVCDLAKSDPGHLLVTESTYRGAGEPAGWSDAGAQPIRGRTQPVLLFHPHCPAE